MRGTAATFGALHLAHETHRDLFTVEVEKGGIAAQKRHQVELIRDETVVAALDHIDVMSGDAGLRDDVVARDATSLAHRGQSLAQAGLALGAGLGRFRRGDDCAALALSVLIPARRLGFAARLGLIAAVLGGFRVTMRR